MTTTAKTKTPLDNVRADAQALLEKIEAAHAKNEAAMRAELQGAANKARDLGASITSLTQAERATVKSHLEMASTRFSEAAEQAKHVAGETAAQLKTAHDAMLTRTRSAIQNLSQAIAAARAAAHSKN